MFAIFCALPAELNYLRKFMMITATKSQGTCRIFEAKYSNAGILLVLTGMGKENAVHAAELVIANYDIDIMISTGFCGSLNKENRPGGLACYSNVACDDTTCRDKEVVRIDDVLIGKTRRSIKGTTGELYVGKGVTTSAVCATPDSKSKLRERSGCDFVDMESYWIGRIANDNNIPFIVIRPVFDSLEDDLSVLNYIMSHGKVDLHKAGAYIFRHPGKIGTLIRFAFVSRQTSRNTSYFMQYYIKKLSNN